MYELRLKSIMAAISMIALVACGDDEGSTSITPVGISFTTNGLTIPESTSAQTLIVNFGDDLPVAASFDIGITGTATYGQDFTTSPEGSTGSITVSANAGDDATTFSFIPVDNNDVDGSRTVILTITSATDGIDIGNQTALIITLTDDDSNSETSAGDISVVASKFYNTSALSVTFDDTWVTISSSNLPDHKSMYYPTTDPLYEAYDEPNNPDFKKNPGEIAAQSYVFKIPRFPAEASNKESTPMGPMGVSINSVVFFNQNAAPGDDILDELNTFDQYEGHPAGDAYHYHIEPIWLTQEQGSDAFLGFLLDGFPVYGPVENGTAIDADVDLDNYHGHVGATADFPDGIYHYHITDELPWINGDGFYGTAGTITN